MQFDGKKVPWKLIITALVGVAIGVTTGDWSQFSLEV